MQPETSWIHITSVVNYFNKVVLANMQEEEIGGINVESIAGELFFGRQ